MNDAAVIAEAVPAAVLAAEPSGGAIGSAVIAAAIAVVLVLPERPGPRRLRAGRRRPQNRWPGLRQLRARPVPPAARRTHRLVAGVVAGGLLLLIGLPWGLLAGVVTFLTIPVGLSRLEPAAKRQRAARIVADLPLAVDLLAACLRAGRPPDDAVRTVSAALGGPLGGLLAEVGHSFGLGVDPVDAWSSLLNEPACGGFARAVQRALRSGAPLATTLEHLAEDVRQERRWTAEEQARAVETRSVLPLGLCFLPAFVLIGIVPSIAGSLAGIVTVVGG